MEKNKMNDRQSRRSPPKWLIDKKRNAITDCATLYLGKKKPMTESLMCFGWECGEGWNDAIAELSYKLEALNMMFYPKYRLRYEAEQVKEKFGDLRFYYSVKRDPPKWRAAVKIVTDGIVEFFKKIDYAYAKKLECPGYTRTQYKQITKEEYDANTNSPSKCVNVNYFENAGYYYRVSRFDIYEKYGFVPTRRKWLYSVMCFFIKAASYVNSWCMVEPTREQRVMAEYMEKIADKYVKDAENACYSLCEQCGMEIGTEYSPRCQTAGWVTYLCEKCADDRGVAYLKDGKHYRSGRLIKDENEN